MTESRKNILRDVAAFHRIVETGSIADLKTALDGGADVNCPGHVGRTPLMLAVHAQDVAKMELLVDRGADLELTDDFNSTALRCAVENDYAQGVRFLLGHGVERGYAPKYELKKINYESDLDSAALPNQFTGIISEEEWRDSLESTRASIREMGQNPTVEPVIADAQSVDVLQMLLDAGDDLNLAPNEVKRLYVGLSNGGEIQLSRKEYESNKLPRFGTRNAEPVDNPFWCEMIRVGGSAYSARDTFNDAHSFDSPVWCYERFGSSVTPLRDGRFVQVGGEHEDFYDPDFQIYNDVVIHDGAGGFQIFGYPEEVFPPTDFHTATLTSSSIYIVGCLGYSEHRRIGQTPVYRINGSTWEIEAVSTSGDSPSWLHQHRATFDTDRNVIHLEGGDVCEIGDDGEITIVTNEERFELDLATFAWRKVR